MIGSLSLISDAITNEKASSMPYTPILQSRKGMLNPKNSSRFSSKLSSRLKG